MSRATDGAPAAFTLVGADGPVCVDGVCELPAPGAGTVPVADVADVAPEAEPAPTD